MTLHCWHWKIVTVNITENDNLILDSNISISDIKGRPARVNHNIT